MNQNVRDAELPPVCRSTVHRNATIFKHSSKLLTTSCSREEYAIISQIVQKLSCYKQTDTPTQKQTLLKTSPHSLRYGCTGGKQGKCPKFINC